MAGLVSEPKLPKTKFSSLLNKFLLGYLEMGLTYCGSSDDLHVPMNAADD